MPRASVPVARVVLYVKDVEGVAAFYERHFGLRRLAGETPGWIELSSGEGCTIAVHQASRTAKSGAAMKLVFAVREVAKFKAASARRGLKFGPIHQVEGFELANAKDPAGNSISISSRGFT